MSEAHEKEPMKNAHFEEAREHMRAARKAMHDSVKAWLPEGFFEQRRAARKEFLMAMRSLVDAAIEHTEKKEKN